MRNPKAPAATTPNETPRVPGGAPGLPAAQVQQPQAAPQAIQPRPAPVGRVQGPRPKKFRVLNGGYVTMGGHKTIIRAGKMVDATQYNLDELRQQGIRLQEVTADERAPLEGFEPPAAEKGGPQQPPRMQDIERHPTQLADHELEQELAQHANKGARGDELAAEKKRRDEAKKAASHPGAEQQ